MIKIFNDIFKYKIVSAKLLILFILLPLQANSIQSSNFGEGNCVTIVHSSKTKTDRLAEIKKTRRFNRKSKRIQRKIDKLFNKIQNKRVKGDIPSYFWLTVFIATLGVLALLFIDISIAFLLLGLIGLFISISILFSDIDLSLKLLYSLFGIILFLIGGGLFYLGI